MPKLSEVLHGELAALEQCTDTAQAEATRTELCKLLRAHHTEIIDALELSEPAEKIDLSGEGIAKRVNALRNSALSSCHLAADMILALEQKWKGAVDQCNSAQKGKQHYRKIAQGARKSYRNLMVLTKRVQAENQIYKSLQFSGIPPASPEAIDDTNVVYCPGCLELVTDTADCSSQRCPEFDTTTKAHFDALLGERHEQALLVAKSTTGETDEHTVSDGPNGPGSFES